MPTYGFWSTGEFQFLSVSAILMLLFHRLRALQVGIVPFTTNTYQPWTFIFANFGRSIAGPPPHIDWTLEWHEILHAWSERAANVVLDAMRFVHSTFAAGAALKLDVKKSSCCLSSSLPCQRGV